MIRPQQHWQTQTRVESFLNPNVSVVECCRLDGHKGLVGLGLWGGYFAQGEGLIEGFEYGSFHKGVMIRHLR